MITYCLLILSGVITKIFVSLFIKLEVKGRKNIPKNVTNLVFSSNHETWIDSWLIMTFTRPMWYLILHPSVISWNVPEFSNYFNTRFKNFLFSHLRCIPVQRGNSNHKEAGAFHERIAEILQEYSILWFFEQTRTRDGKIGEAKQGVGRAIFKNKSRVIPIRINGMGNVWPIKSKFPRLSLFNKKEVTIHYGEPLRIDDLLKGKKGKVTNLAIGRRIKEAVEQL